MGLAIAAGFILLISVVAFKKYLPYAGSTVSLKEPPSVVISMEDTRLIGMGDGDKAWSLEADRVDISRDRSVATVYNISDGLIFEDKKIAFEVEAGSARYDTRRKDLQLTDGISIQGSDGRKITGSSAYWNSTTSTLRSSQQVDVEMPTGKITAKDVTVDLKSKEISMSDVELQIDVEEVKRKISQEGQ